MTLRGGDQVGAWQRERARRYPSRSVKRHDVQRQRPLAPNVQTMDVDDAIVMDRRGHVQILTINRESALNCIDAPASRALGDAVEAADRDPGIRAIVLTGAGSRAFCAGADLKALAAGQSPVPPEEPYRSWGFGGFVTHPISTPTIAAVNGVALGGGAELVLASDLIVASAEASFGFPEVRFGIFAAGGGALRLADRIPRAAALELLLTGATITADRALQLGLINRVVPAEDVLSTALALADQVARNAPLAVQATKRLATHRPAPHDDAAAWASNALEWSAVAASQDAAEGARAFGEKRVPHWAGN